MDVHVGELIKKRVSELGLSVSEFARRLHCNRQNVYDIFARRSVDIELLQRISKILQHDFIADGKFNQYGSAIPQDLLYHHRTLQNRR